jgi:hypothetical protein
LCPRGRFAEKRDQASALPRRLIAPTARAYCMWGASVVKYNQTGAAALQPPALWMEAHFMKTTRILGFAAGLMAVISAIVLAFGVFITMNPERFPSLTMPGWSALVAGFVFILVSAIPGVAHLALRIRFRKPFHARGPSGFLTVCRVLVWIWGILLVSAILVAALWGYYQIV